MSTNNPLMREQALRLYYAYLAKSVISTKYSKPGVVYNSNKVLKKSTSGVPFGRAGHLGEHIFHAPGARLWHYAAELCTILVMYPLCGLGLTNTTDNPSEMCRLKLTDYCCLCLCHQSYTILHGPLIPPNGFCKVS